MKIGHEDTTTNKHQTTSVVKSATKPVTSESDKIQGAMADPDMVLIGFQATNNINDKWTFISEIYWKDHSLRACVFLLSQPSYSVK